MMINPTPVTTDETRTLAFAVTDGPVVTNVVKVETITVTVVRTDGSPWRADGIELTGPRVDGSDHPGRLVWDGRNVRSAPDWAHAFAVNVAVTANVEDRPAHVRTMTATVGRGGTSYQAGRNLTVSQASASTVTNTVAPGAQVTGHVVQAGHVQRLDFDAPDFGGYASERDTHGMDAADYRH